MRLAPFPRPRSVAIVGAGDRPTSSGGAVLANLRRAGFAGEIVPINPKLPPDGRIGGLPARASLRELRKPVELVVVVVRPELIPEVVRDAAATGHRRLLIRQSARPARRRPRGPLRLRARTEARVGAPPA
jgi:acetyltransferase